MGWTHPPCWAGGGGEWAGRRFLACELETVLQREVLSAEEADGAGGRRLKMGIKAGAEQGQKEGKDGALCLFGAVI